MGSKIIKSLAVISAMVIGFSFSTANVEAYPSNAMVKVGIMDNAYKTVEKSSVTIYGTEECVLFDNVSKEEGLRLPKGKFLTIEKNNGTYRLTFTSTDNLAEKAYEIDQDFTITCPNGVMGIKDLMRGGKDALYRGEFRITSTNNLSKFYLVNCLDVEYYLKGVVPSEMPVYFGLEALKAQAVAARNYSLSPRTKIARSYDVVDSVASQVYHGFNRESDIANKAIDETHGLVALYDDEMIIAVFSSTAGGYTESYSNTFSDSITKAFPCNEKDYLMATPDNPNFKPLNNEDDAFEFYSTKPESFDVHSPLYRWTKVWTKEELENALKSTLVVQSKTGFVEPALNNSEDFGSLKGIKVTSRGDSGKIITMEVQTDKNTFTIGKELVIRRAFTKDGKALPSANVVFKYNIDEQGNWSEITAYGGGFGHGCGLSQYGAMYMAKDCKMSFDEILKHYYKDICIATKPLELKDNFATVCFYAPSKKATLVITNAYDTQVLQMSINNEIVNLNIEKSKNERYEADVSRYIKKGELNTVTFTPPCQNRLDTRRMDKVKPITIYIRMD